jgi:DNA-directed RNA polymerase subunit beta'
LKENVIVGRLIPAGTGAVMNRLREIAAKRDRDMAVEADVGAGQIQTAAIPQATTEPPPAAE